MFKKKIIYNTFLFLLLSFPTHAQYALHSEISNGNMDNNVSIMLEKTHKRHTFGVGLKIHLRTPYLDDGQYHTFYRNSYATAFSEFIGAKVGYEKRLTPDKWKTLNFIAFGNSYFSRFRTHRPPFSTYIFERMNFLETNFGLGMKVKLFEPVYLTCKIGGGACLIWDLDPTIGLHGGYSVTYEFSRLFSAGINVKL